MRLPQRNIILLQRKDENKQGVRIADEVIEPNVVHFCGIGHVRFIVIQNGIGSISKKNFWDRPQFTVDFDNRTIEDSIDLCTGQ